MDADLAVRRATEGRVEYDRIFPVGRYCHAERIDADDALGEPQGAMVGKALVVAQPIMSSSSACNAK